MHTLPRWVLGVMTCIVFVFSSGISYYFMLGSKIMNRTKSGDISLILLYFILWGGLIFSSFFFTFASKENFFFEVSPERERCLKEQVSRNNFGAKRSCACCGKGTVGGIPPNYAEWLAPDPDTGDTWHRPENVRVLPMDTFSNGEEASCTACGPPSYITYI